MADTDGEPPRAKRWKVCDNMGGWHEVVASFAYIPEGSNMILLMADHGSGNSVIAAAFAEPAACYSCGELATEGGGDKVISLSERRG